MHPAETLVQTSVVCATDQVKSEPVLSVAENLRLAYILQCNPGWKYLRYASPLLSVFAVVIHSHRNACNLFMSAIVVVQLSC